MGPGPETGVPLRAWGIQNSPRSCFQRRESTAEPASILCISANSFELSSCHGDNFHPCFTSDLSPWERWMCSLSEISKEHDIKSLLMFPLPCQCQEQDSTDITPGPPACCQCNKSVFSEGNNSEGRSECPSLCLRAARSMEREDTTNSAGAGASMLKHYPKSAPKTHYLNVLGMISKESLIPFQIKYCDWRKKRKHTRVKNVVG